MHVPLWYFYPYHAGKWQLEPIFWLLAVAKSGWHHLYSFYKLEFKLCNLLFSSNLSLSPHLTCFDFRFMLTRQQVIYGLERVELRSTDLFIECPFRLALERNGWEEGPEGRQRPGGEPRCKGLDLLYRTADGTCNNLKHTSWGSSFMPFLRFLPPDYSDGVQVI